ncbi:MAG: acyl-[ACP]--phospholipid O-acyltransferase [Gammaproteobacteria bacterium]|jgi:acyl-[acyl-carrier-protein]-phospholipid O-acyltransferase/long-chain-fatty-acid--[acyl-carrier-protein] ligase|nr:acyl-[ACP]--phospholipid O-acyltransferase [Gammaproteobacteria bacterium]
MNKLFKINGFSSYILMLFLNAFVDLGHKIVIQNTIFKSYDGQTQVILTAIVNALILLPFIFLFSPAGFISDKYPKHLVMRYSAWAAVVAVLLIIISYYQGWFWCAFAMTFALGIQSAIYSPAKYGFIRELVGDAHLAQSNGIVQAVTIVAILGGTFIFSGLFEFMLQGMAVDHPSTIVRLIAPIGWLLLGLTLIEVWLAYRLPGKKETDTSKKFSTTKYFQGIYLKHNLKAITSKKVIWLSIVGLSMFWAISQVVLASFPAYAKEVLLETNTLVIQGILACTGFGIIFGSLLAGRVSKNYIELGLIPVSALGFAIVLGFIPVIETRVGMAMLFMMLGFLGGIFIIPLNALIQYHAKEDELGTVLAGSNWIQNIAMLLFLLLTIVFASWGITGAKLFYILVAVGFAGAFYTVYELPHSLTRILVAVLIRQKYKINIIGFDRLPKTGGVLLLGNHISWIDWAIIQIACPRPVRFVMLRSIYNRWYLKPFFQLFGVIPISAGQSRESINLINEKLKSGEVVCLFPEGAISRTGSLGLFHAGYERAIEGVNGVIVPFYLHGMWGSRLSRADSEKLRKNTARGYRRDVIITFGKSLPVDIKADQLKQKIFELSFEAWECYSSNFDPLPLAWICSAKEKLSRTCVIEGQGMMLSHAKMIAATAAFARCMRNIDREKNIAVLLPASSASIIANMAVMLNGQATVNLNYTASVLAVQAGIRNAGLKTVYTSEKFLEKIKQRGIDVDSMLQGLRVVTMEQLQQDVSKAFLAVSFVALYVLPASWYYALFGRKVLVNDPAAILFSSGSEGLPKGIVLSHRNFMSNIKQISDVLKTREDDVIMGCLPPFHSFGLTVTTLMPLIEGIPVVCYPDPTDVLNVAKAICRHAVTLMCATATFLRLYTKNHRVNPLMLDSLRMVVSGAEKLSADVRNEFKAKFNKEVYEGYGATETTPVASVNVSNQLDISDWSLQVGHKVGTVGMPVPGCAFRIVDPHTLQSLPIGEDGLILISGTQVMLGYLNEPEKTHAAIVELEDRRWYKTGDKGHLDSDGFLTIVDRYSRFAKIGGEMISLGAVEQEIKKVITASEIDIVAVSVPDDKKGEQIVLLSTLVIDMNDLRKKLLEINCNPLMIPSVVHFVEAVPKLGSGKTDFGVAKKQALEVIMGLKDN